MRDNIFSHKHEAVECFQISRNKLNEPRLVV